jgi:uncharacterized protein YbjT (DUF2867 family)
VKITVTTPTGNIGSKLTGLLLDRGAELTVIARHPEKVDQLAARGARVIAGEHSDPAIVRQAVEGADCLFWVVPADYQTKDPRGHEHEFVEAASSAVVANPKLNFVLLSSIGAHRSEGTGPILGLHDHEERLRNEAKNLTCLRPNYFMENVLVSLPTIVSQSSIYSVVPGTVTAPQVATRDIAQVAADALLTPKSGQRIIDIIGPQDISMNDVADILTRVLGKPVQHVVIPDEHYIAGMSEAGISVELAKTLVEMEHSFTDGLTHELRGDSKVVAKTTFEQFVREVVLPSYRKAASTAA